MVVVILFFIVVSHCFYRYRPSQLSPRIADKVTSVLATLRRDFGHVTIRTWHTFSTAHLAGKIRALCDRCPEDTLRTDTWDPVYWCKDQLSPVCIKEVT